MSYLVTQRIRIERYKEFEDRLRETGNTHITKPIVLGNWVMVHFKIKDMSEAGWVFEFESNKPPKKKPWWRF